MKCEGGQCEVIQANSLPLSVNTPLGEGKVSVGILVCNMKSKSMTLSSEPEALDSDDFFEREYCKYLKKKIVIKNCN